MKKFFALLTALVMGLVLLTAFAADVEAIPSPEADDLTNTAILSGYVYDVQDEFLLIKTPDGLYTEAHLTPDTLFEGKDVMVGDFIHVTYNGMMTRSLPAQVTADHVRGYEIIGTVTEMTETGFILTVEGEELPYTVAPKEDAMMFVQPEPGMEVIVVTDGLMTASADQILVNATEVLPLPTVQEIFDMAGMVTETGDGFIMIETADGQQVQVNLSEETFFDGKEEIAAGDYIPVTYNGMMTRSLPAQISAMKVGCYVHTGAISDLGESSFILNTELEPIIVNATAEQLADLADGMTVTVYSNGAMTMSLPAQIGADMITVTETIVD